MFHQETIKVIAFISKNSRNNGNRELVYVLEREMLFWIECEFRAD